MADESQGNDRLRDLTDAYLDDVIDSAGLAELESLLREDPNVQTFFARYAQANTDIALEVAARGALEGVLARIPAPSATPARMPSPRAVRWVVAASLFLGMLIGGGAVGLFAAQAVPKTVPAPSLRTWSVDFRHDRSGTLLDVSGIGTGFTHRLPGTGTGLASRDPNLRVFPDAGRLELTATGSDLNTRFRVEQAEFPGIRLADLGFTGSEDFEVAATVVDVPTMAFVGQFGVYAGVAADWAFRGGLVSQREQASYRQFVVNTRDGRDKDAYFIGLGAPGDQLHMRLARMGGKFSIAVENRTTGATSTLATRHSEFLDGRADVLVGLFASDPRGTDHKAVRFTEFTAKVWVSSPAR